MIVTLSLLLYMLSPGIAIVVFIGPQVRCSYEHNKRQVGSPYMLCPGIAFVVFIEEGCLKNQRLESEVIYLVIFTAGDQMKKRFRRCHSLPFQRFERQGRKLKLTKKFISASLGNS